MRISNIFIQGTQRLEEGVWYYRAGVTGHCKTPGMGAGIQTNPIEEQQIFLTCEPSLLPLNAFILYRDY